MGGWRLARLENTVGYGVACLMPVCPLIFEPIYKPRIWGGRRLAELFERPLPGADPIGESWEVADLADDRSVARAGEQARGRNLGQLVREWGSDLLGPAAPADGRFPLLIKFLDARDVLSVQVHPDETMAAAIGGGVRPKNEAWYIVAADENAVIYRGLKPGVDRKALLEALETEGIEQVLRRIPVRAGHCYYLPGGTLHALGAGVVAAEVQTPSDVTYRLHDWGRIEPATGNGRPLHVEEAMRCIAFESRDYPEEKRSHVASVWTSMSRLITSGSFIVERVRMTVGIDQPIPYAEMVIWMILQGRGRIGYGKAGDAVAFSPGDTVVLPAGLGESRVTTDEDCVWLEVTLPKGGGPGGRSSC